MDWNYKMHEGIIEELPDEGMETLVDGDFPVNVIPATSEKINHAKRLFFKRDANEEDKKSAIKALGELLECVRTGLKETNLKQDTKDIFPLLNRYDIRHHNALQQQIHEPYLSWTFYALLNVIHTYLKLRQQR